MSSCTPENHVEFPNTGWVDHPTDGDMIYHENLEMGLDFTPEASLSEDKLDHFQFFTVGREVKHHPTRRTSEGELYVTFKLRPSNPITFRSMELRMKPVHGNGSGTYKVSARRGNVGILSSREIVPDNDATCFSFTNVGSSNEYNITISGFDPNDPAFEYRIHLFTSSDERTPPPPPPPQSSPGKTGSFYWNFFDFEKDFFDLNNGALYAYAGGALILLILLFVLFKGRGSNVWV